MSDVTSKIREVYQTSGYPSFTKLKQLLKQKRVPFTEKEVKEFLDRQKVQQLHRKPKRKHNIPIVAPQENFTFQADLLDMSNFARQNQGYRWIFIAIDIFTRKAAAIPQKTKEASESLKSVQEVLQQMGKPVIIHTDDGKEYQADFDRALKKSGIIRRVNAVGDHNRLGLIDRFSQTVKNMLYKHFEYTDQLNWVSILPTFMNSYNNSPHSALCGMTPNEAVRYDTDTTQCHVARMEKVQFVSGLEVGDTVRVRLKRKVFDKGYERQWSLLTYTIAKKDGINYVLSNDAMYRENELQKIPEEESTPPQAAAETEKAVEKKQDLVKKARRERQRVNFRKREGITPENIIEAKRGKPESGKDKAVDKAPEAKEQTQKDKRRARQGMKMENVVETKRERKPTWKLKSV